MVLNMSAQMLGIKTLRFLYGILITLDSWDKVWISGANHEAD
jgi:hypothetical protein